MIVRMKTRSDFLTEDEADEGGGEACSSWMTVRTRCGGSPGRRLTKDLLFFGSALEWDPREAIELVRRGTKIGEGATCAVYRSQMPCGSVVAIKVVDISLDVSAEVQALSNYRHPCIVTFMGYARGKHKQFLMFEHLPNQDVAHALYSSEEDASSVVKNVRMSWMRRAKIAVDLAGALAYLHSRRPRLYHRDVKSGNLLLDEFGRAKLADFGLAVVAHSSRVVVPRSEGTPGYADPSYMATHNVDDKTDVFSLGVVLVELLTGQCPAVYARKMARGPASGSRPSGYVIRYFTDVIDLSDPCSLLPYADTRCIWPTLLPLEWSELALNCMSPKPETRPSAVEVQSAITELILRFGDEYPRRRM